MNIGRCKHLKLLQLSVYRTFSGYPSPQIFSSISSVGSFSPSQAVTNLYYKLWFIFQNFILSIHYHLICVWLLLLSILWLWHSSMVLHVSVEFVLLSCKAIFHCFDTAHFVYIHSPVDGHLDCFHLRVVNKASTPTFVWTCWLLILW